MDLLVMAALVVFGGLAVVGSIWLLIVTFSESLVWGLVSLVVPVALFVFVFTHWDQAKGAFKLYAAGMAGVVLTLALSMPGAQARAQERQAAAASARAAASAAPAGQGVACPPTDPASSGFARWCCTPAGWIMTSQGDDCTSTPRPTGECDVARSGTTTTEGCSTLGAAKRRR